MILSLKNIKKLIICLAIPLLAGFVGYLLGGSSELYSSIVQPSFAPPAFLFPIVWTILYILMGISSYFISFYNNNSALRIYYIQLAVNSLWSLWFFRFSLFLFSAFWIVLLIFLVSYMIYLFFQLDRKAAFLQFPYLAWLIFACILNFSIYFLN